MSELAKLDAIIKLMEKEAVADLCMIAATRAARETLDWSDPTKRVSDDQFQDFLRTADRIIGDLLDSINWQQLDKKSLASIREHAIEAFRKAYRVHLLDSFLQKNRMPPEKAAQN